MIPSFKLGLVLLLSLATEANGQFTCTLAAKDPGTCDASKSSDGSDCTWCSWSSLGFCVSGEQAIEMKQIFKSLKCDNDAADDDKAPAPTTDDDAPASDDDVSPDDNGLWKCLEEKDAKSCGGNSCVWCDTKAGFAVCMTEEAADLAKDSYWFDCKDGAVFAGAGEAYIKGVEQQGVSAGVEPANIENEEGVSAGVEPAYIEDEEEGVSVGVEPAYIGDEDEGVSAGVEPAYVEDEEEGVNVGVEPAYIGDDEGVSVGVEPAYIGDEEEGVSVGVEPAYIGDDGEAVSVGVEPAYIGDEEEGVSVGVEPAYIGDDEEGVRVGVEPAYIGDDQEEGVSVGVEPAYIGDEEEEGVSVGVEQAYIGDDEEEEGVSVGVEPAYIGDEEEGISAGVEPAYIKGESDDQVQDPLDTACLMAQLVGGNDESSCVAAIDSDGNSCEWCAVSGFNFCLNAEQAQIAELVGGACGKESDSGASFMSLNDPLDTACLLAQVTGGSDESSCVAASGSDGNTCEWCILSNGMNFCLNAEQAQIAEMVGSTCDATASGAGVGPAPLTEKKVDDPLDTACLMAQLVGGNDESSCVGAMDSDGNACEWCAVSGMNFCLNDEQAQIAALIGGSCGKEDTAGASFMSPKDPWDTSCLIAQVTAGSDKSSCLESNDADGKTCEWCTLSNGMNFCLNAEQAQYAETMGSACDSEIEIVSSSTQKSAGVSVASLKNGDAKDPLDSSCLMASLMGGNDEASCISSFDNSGDACEWCSFNGGLNFCLNADQSQAAALVGGTCEHTGDIGVTSSTNAKDPLDTACLMASIMGGNDGRSCATYKDSDGNQCEFCTIGGSLQLCLAADQAQIAELVGATCDQGNTSTHSEDEVIRQTIAEE